MDIICNLRNNNLIVKIAGEIDHHEVDRMRTIIDREFFRLAATNIVFDFAHVGFMDSSGIGMIIGRYKEVQKVGGTVFAVNINPAVNRIFDISGLKKIVQCYEGFGAIGNYDDYKALDDESFEEDGKWQII